MVDCELICRAIFGPTGSRALSSGPIYSRCSTPSAPGGLGERLEKTGGCQAWRRIARRQRSPWRTLKARGVRHLDVGGLVQYATTVGPPRGHSAGTVRSAVLCPGRGGLIQQIRSSRNPVPFTCSRLPLESRSHARGAVRNQPPPAHAGRSVSAPDQLGRLVRPTFAPAPVRKGVSNAAGSDTLPRPGPGTVRPAATAQRRLTFLPTQISDGSH